MRDNWNFHADVALPLERYGRNIIGKSFVSADDIESGAFVDAILSILSVRIGNLNDISDFIDMCMPYNGKPSSQILNKTAQTIFLEFERLLKNQK